MISKALSISLGDDDTFWESHENLSHLETAFPRICFRPTSVHSIHLPPTEAFTKTTMSLTHRLPRRLLPLLQIRYTTRIPHPSPPVPSKQPTSSSPPALQQSPNMPTTWSTSQNPKPHAFDNARFEQIDLGFQPNAPSAMGMSAKDPVRLVLGRRAVCDGGESTCPLSGRWREMGNGCWLLMVCRRGSAGTSEGFHQPCTSILLQLRLR